MHRHSFRERSHGCLRQGTWPLLLFMNSDHPSEISPLLERQSQDNDDSHRELPCILDAEHDLYSEREGLSVSLLLTSSKVIEDVVRAYSLPSQELVDALTLVLCLRRISGTFLESHGSIPPWAFIPAPEIEEYVMGLWKRLSTETSDDELNNILWTTFTLRKHDVYPKCISVIQTLIFDSPTPIALDIRLSKVLADTWRRGGAHKEAANSASLKLSNYAALTAPRVLHVVDLSVFLLYIGIASNYALKPATYNSDHSQNASDPRTVALLVYSVSRLLTTKWTQNIHFALMAFSIILSSNLSPGMNDSTYILFLLSLSIHVVQLQLPLYPSPILLFPSLRSLPISCIFHTIVTQIFIPAFLFFLPAFLIVSFLLSLSLSDVFILLRPHAFFEPAPENARFAFVILGSLVLALFSCLITCMVLASPTTVAPSRRAMLSWDAYGTKVGLATRQTFYHAVHHYSRPHVFPAPLNLLEILLVILPCTILRIFKRERWAKRVEHTLERVLWTFVVFPLAVCFGSIWLWGLLL